MISRKKLKEIKRKKEVVKKHNIKSNNQSKKYFKKVIDEESIE